ncbi:MAG: TetR/AcrR family transcriptional regulator [Simkaniaceae bacterium]|nr:TetR/AcrR family transcriptional regulator [Simkaniaceae bacterium]
MKAVILKHGWKILREKGRGALRLRDLAKESDCSVGTIYNLFENLDEIILRLNLKCLDQLYSSLHREMKEGIVHQESLKKVLRRLGKAYIAFGIEYPLMWRSLFENLAIDPVPQWYQEKVDGEMAVIRQTIESSYGLEVEKVSQIVNFFWAAIHGMTAIILNKKMKEIDDDYIDTYFDQCLRGFIE